MLRHFFLALCLSAAAAAAVLPSNTRPVGQMVRRNLTASELAAPQRAHFVLKLRNYDELCARVNRGETMSVAELTNRYFPTHESWVKVANWATAHGYSVQPEEMTHMVVFGSAPVANVQRTLHVQYARITDTNGDECTSTLDQATVPAELENELVGISGLHSHVKPRHAQSVTVTTGSSQFLNPATLRQIYNANASGLDGTGQTIVILEGGVVNPADLTAFWAQCGLPTTIDQFTEIDASGPQVDTGAEATLDVEAASAMAPKAKILFLTGGYDTSTTAPLLINRLATDPGMHQISHSAALPESFFDSSEPGDSQFFAALAAAGFTFFVSSGDGGSSEGNRTNSGGYYDPNVPPYAEYPASNPFVTAVGGTSIELTWNSGYQLPAIEGGWTLSDPPIIASDGSVNEGGVASGGGLSVFFPRPAWQVGPNLPAGNMRCVPDVAAMAAGTPGFFIYYRGAPSIAEGTSLSAPIWAGLCALLNQARANANLPPLGLLGPHIYPLIGTPAFNQMTTGSTGSGAFTTTANNGAYGMGANYNLVTGLGSPNIGEFIARLTTGSEVGALATIVAQPADATVTAGNSMSLSVAATGTGLTYQWYFNSLTDHVGPVDSSTGYELGRPIAGATAATYSIATAASHDAGWYTVAVNSGTGTVFSRNAVLTVNYAAEISSQPTDTTVAAGFSAALSVQASAVPTATYQWYHDGAAISGATQSTYIVRSATQADAGSYSVVLTNAIGSTQSASAAVTVTTTVSQSGYLFTTLAGTAGPGSWMSGNVDATGPDAKFDSPTAITVAANGDVYVGCMGVFGHPTNTIRKITRDGIVTTFAGAGPYGTTDGPSTIATFGGIEGLYIDAHGTMFVADQADVIRQITTDGQVSTIAGVGGADGQIDGVGADARLFWPMSITGDSSGNLYSCEYWGRVRMIDPNWLVTTIAGSGIAGTDRDGTGLDASFFAPTGITMDSAGNLYTADFGGFTIRKITPDRVVTTVAGNARAQPEDRDGIGANARFYAPSALVCDASGNLFVLSSGCTVKKVTPDGHVTTIAGQAMQPGSSDGIGIAAQFQYPKGIAIDSNGVLYIADTSNGTIRKGTPVATVAIIADPQSTPVATGAAFTLSVTALGSPSPTYQWYLNGQPISGATSATYHVGSATADDAGTYTVVVSNIVNQLTSAAATVQVGDAPAITTAPTSASVTTGQSVGLSVAATGTATLSYQWNFNGSPITGATAATYSVASAQLSDAGSYTVEVSNAFGHITSSAATVLVQAPPAPPSSGGNSGGGGGGDGSTPPAPSGTAPAITTAPVPTSVAAGKSVQLTVAASGTPTLTYQWLLNGAAITGATSSTYSIASAQSADAGNYTCTVSNAYGSVTSSTASLVVVVFPSIATQPVGSTVVVGAKATFTVVASSSAPLTYQWAFNGVVIAGATSSSFTIDAVTMGDAGSYTCTVINLAGSLNSDAAVLVVKSPPSIAIQPSDVTVTAGSSATFTVVPADATDVTYQWSFNGAPIAGATAASYTLPSVTANNGGAYSVTVTNSVGVVSSRSATLTVRTVAAYAPTISTQPVSQTVATGSTIVFTCNASVSPGARKAARTPQPRSAVATAYQWYCNGVALSDGSVAGTTISGSATSTLMIQHPATGNAGVYTCVVTTPDGSAMSMPATLALTSTPTNPGRLINLSCRATVGTDANVLISGFVIGGASNASLPVLLRAAGPTLAGAPFNVPGTLPDPKLDLHESVNAQDTVVGSNSRWAGDTTIAARAKTVGAFPWQDTTQDSALAMTIANGAYTGITSGATGDSGVALAEVYDATPAGTYNPVTSARLVNLSARARVGTGAGVLIGGFVIGGDTAVTVLIRASGPALSKAPFNLGGTLADPKLELHQTINNTDTVLASNVGWGGNAQVVAAANAVGAFDWSSATSADSALVVTLPPGAYTAIVSGAAGTASDTGIALLEVYEVP